MKPRLGRKRIQMKGLSTNSHWVYLYPEVDQVSLPETSGLSRMNLTKGPLNNLMKLK